MTTVEMISKNTISLIRSLGQKKFRHLNMLFIAEGKKIIVETLREEKYSVHKLFLTENALRELQPMFQNTIDAQIISDEELRKISFLTEPDFGLAILECKETPNQISIKGEKLTLVLDGIRDPGNLGTIVRIADWFGIRNIVCSEDTTDFYSPKVVQSSMGSFNRVNLFYTELKRFMSEFNEKHNIYGALLNGENLPSVKPLFPALLVIGSESHGISKEILPFIHHKVTIPSNEASGAESLNAAIATSILTYHFSLINP